MIVEIERDHVAHLPQDNVSVRGLCNVPFTHIFVINPRVARSRGESPIPDNTTAATARLV